MIDDSEKLIFSESPSVLIAGVLFNCRTLIQYFDTPLLDIVHEMTTHNLPCYTTKIPIFHPDGMQLAVAKGAQLYPTEPGKKAGVAMKHHPGLTVCERDGKTLFEIKRPKAAAISITAELYTNDGTFVKWSDDSISDLLFQSLQANFPKLGLTLEPIPEGGFNFHRFDGRSTIVCAKEIIGELGILIGNRTQPPPGGDGLPGAAIYIGEGEPIGEGRTAGRGGAAIQMMPGATLGGSGILRGGLGGKGKNGCRGGNGGHAVHIPWPNLSS